MNNFEEKEFYVIYTNSDLTEGRGREYPIIYCEFMTTAKRLAKGRYVMGTDSPIRTEKLVYIDGNWYKPLVPVHVEQPSLNDVASEQLEKYKLELLQKLQDAGFTKEDLNLIVSSSVKKLWDNKS